MAPCKFAYTLSELTIRRAPQNMRCRTIQTVMTVRLSVAEVCSLHCTWRASTSVHKQLLLARPGAAGRYCFIWSVLVLPLDPATCAASLFCAGYALPVNVIQMWWGTFSSFSAGSSHMRTGFLTALSCACSTMGTCDHSQGLTVCTVQTTS